ncbi:hypothetical protein CcaverHIS002_0102120 [Cutaneotrichosporon cavernicola]|nr:hypothetical protein CcaverHIS002_0102120 [Cutaneotrichosporon cavernicola]
MVWNTNVMATSPSPSPSSARPRLNLDVRDKRLPSLPFPLSRGKDGSWALGAYDNKLVSSTLSQLPPLPPHSPGGMSSTGSNLSSFSHSSSPSHVPRGTPSLVSVSMPRPAPQPSSAGGVLLLPDGTTLPTGEPGGQPEREPIASGPHSSSSPWSLLTVHVLPPLRGHLCNSHIVTTSQRTPASRLIGVLTADLRDFIASGMLTLKAKFDTIDEAKVVSRAAEARYSSFYTPREPGEAEAHDLETSESVDELARAVRWSMVVRTVSPEPVQSEAHERKGSVDTPRRPGLTRAPSLSQAGRIRRRNRGSGSISSLEPELKAAMGERRGTWEGPTIHEGEEQSLAPTTLRDETLQGSVATLTDRTPTADRARLPAAAAAAAAKSAAAAGARRHARKYSSGESDLSSVFSGMGRR